MRANLIRGGWTVAVAMGRERGADVIATRGGERWIIECKGSGSLPPMDNNYFIGALGELLQRMTDDAARYSVAFPDQPKFRRLWSELPEHPKRSLGLSCLFVSPTGNIVEAW